MNQQNQVITLHDVKLDVLKQLFQIVATLNRSNDTICFQISQNQITASNKNLAESVIKYWNINPLKLAEKTDNLTITPVNVSIFNGQEFSKKVLAYFGQLATIDIVHNGTSAQKLTLKKLSKEGKLLLKIDVVCGKNEIAYFGFTEQQLDIAFANKDEFQKTKIFGLQKEDIVNLKKLITLKTNPEVQKRYVKFYSDGTSVRATDDVFDIVICDDTYNMSNRTIEVDKVSIMLIEPSLYSCELAIVQQFSLFILSDVTEVCSKQISINLLSSVDSSTNWEDYTNFDEGFDD